METVVSPARHPPARLAVYGERPEVRIRIEELLADATLTTTGRRADFESLVEDAAVGIVVLERCEPMDVQWLRGVFDRGHCAPSCVVLTPHTLTRFLRLRRLQSSRFHVVWAEELEGRLTQLLAQLEPWHRDPLRLLGHRLLSDFPLRSSLVTVIDRICSVFTTPRPEPPPHSVADLARGVALQPDTLRHHWRNEIPLRCGPKQLLGWALLFWGIRRRAHTGWDAIAQQAGLRRRTLERASVRLAGCTLAGLIREPDSVRRRFRNWVRKMTLSPRRAPSPVSRRSARRAARPGPRSGRRE